MADSDNKDEKQGDNYSVHHADEAARQQAVAKMKQAQAELDEGDDAISSGGQDDDDDKKVKRSDIDPKAKKALQDLLGKNTEEHGQLAQVKVYSPFRIYYDSPASSVSAVNGTGPFDILPGHKNFLTLLSPGDIVVRSKTGKEETITIERGVMHVHGNDVKIFLDV